MNGTGMVCPRSGQFFVIEASHSDSATFQAFLDNEQLWDQLELGYTKTLGHPMLRQAIAEIYNGIHMEDIIVVVPEEGIFLLNSRTVLAGIDL
ncbi:MAG: hypothetical protein PVF29_01860 [Desulfobacterales bacterium]|jgi:hypothetical protein